MNKKEHISLKPIIFIFTIIFLISIFTSLLVHFTYNKFNPETDVCLEEIDCKLNKDNTYEIFLNSEEIKYPQLNEKIFNECFDFFDDISDFGDTGKSLYYCNKWKPKTICELDPEAEGCICDEYQIIEHNTDNFVCEEQENGGYLCVEEVNDFHHFFFFLNETNMINMTFTTNDSCIKSHLPNECEAENPDYVLGKDYVKVGEHETKCLLNDRCGSNRTICRQKTIHDFSCQELKIPILYFWKNTIIKNGELVKLGYFGITPNIVYHRDDIIETFIIKDCLI